MKSVVYPNNIPGELKALDIWLIWKRETVPGADKPKKLPYQAKNPLAPAANNRSNEWCNFKTAQFIYENNGAHGIGAACVSPYVFGDIDNCIVDGVLDPEVFDLIKSLDTYTEISQSKTGLHFIGRVLEPLLPEYKKAIINKYSKFGMQIATSNQFLYITGDVFETFSRIRTLDKILKTTGEQLLQQEIQTQTPPIPKHINNFSLSICDNWGLDLTSVGGLPDDRKQDGPRKYRGSHPVHGSTTKNNYRTDGDVWYCERDGHKTGGGPLEFFAVKEGIIKCEDVRPGCLDNHWSEVFDALKRSGYTPREQYKPIKTTRPDLIPTQKVNTPLPDIPEIAQQVLIETPIKDKKTGEVTGTKLSLNNQKLALYLIDKFATISTGGDIYVYKEGVYSRDTGEIHSIITSVAREIGLQNQTNNITQITSMLLGTNFYPDPPFNYRVGYIPLRNGYIIIDFEKEEVSGPFPHTPDNKFTYCLPVDYNPNAPITPVEDLFREWVGSEDVDLLAQIPAQGIIQSMIDDTFKKSYLLQGERNSGKSSYLELLYRTLGKKSGALALVSLHSMTGNRFALAELENTILNCYDDLGDEELVGFGTFKKLTGSTYHQIERKNKNPKNARIFCAHVFACNIPPRVPERAKYDPAFWDRWEYIVFPFTHEINPLFHNDKYSDAFLSGFLNLIIKTIIRIYKDRRLVINRGAEEVMEKWFLDSDPLNQFINENTTTTDINGKYIATPKRFDKKKLHGLYLEWCRDKRVDQRKIIDTIEKFSRDIQKYGFIPSKQRVTVDKRSEVVNCYIATRLWVGGMINVEPTIQELGV